MPKKKREEGLTEVNKPIFSRFSALYQSFYSTRLYIDVLRRWKGWGTMYLLLVVLILCIPLSTRIMIDFTYFLQKEVIDVIDVIPEFTVQNGKVHFNKPMPFEIKNKHQEVVGIIDTTGKTTSINDKKLRHLSFLITKDKIYYRAPSYHFFSTPDVEPSFGPLYEEKLGQNINEVFTGDEFVKFAHIQKLKYISMLIIYPLLVAVIYVLLAGFFLFSSVVGQLISKLILKSSITFAQSCRLITVSATPALLVLFTYLTFDIHFWGSSTIFIALIAIYYCIGTLAYKKDMQQIVRT